MPFDRLSFTGDCRVALEPRTSWVSGCALSATAGRVLVVGSAGGGPKHPDWYHNLVANPQVTVETGIFTYEAVALVLRDAERDEIFARLVEQIPVGANTNPRPPEPSPWSRSPPQPAGRRLPARSPGPCSRSTKPNCSQCYDPTARAATASSGGPGGRTPSSGANLALRKTSVGIRCRASSLRHGLSTCQLAHQNVAAQSRTLS
ncbi:MAG TPA: nitroreductase/quinone reductase family protein [Kribbella sp.]